MTERKKGGTEIDRSSWRLWKQIEDPSRLTLLSDRLRQGLSYHYPQYYITAKLLQSGVHYYEPGAQLPPEAEGLTSFTIGFIGPQPDRPPRIKRVGRYTSKLSLRLEHPGGSGHYHSLEINLPISDKPFSVYTSSSFLKSPAARITEFTPVEISAKNGNLSHTRRPPLYANPLTVMQALTGVDLNSTYKLTVEEALLGIVDPNLYQKVTKDYAPPNQTPNFLLATRLSIK